MISVCIKLDKEITEKNKEDLIKAATYIVEQILLVNSNTIRVSVEENEDEVKWFKRILYKPSEEEPS